MKEKTDDEVEEEEEEAEEDGDDDEEDEEEGKERTGTKEKRESAEGPRGRGNASINKRRSPATQLVGSSRPSPFFGLVSSSSSSSRGPRCAPSARYSN